MKKMFILILYSLLVLIIGLVSGKCFASSNKLKNYLSNKNNIISIDWNNIEKSSLYLEGILEDNQPVEKSGIWEGVDTIKKGQMILEESKLKFTVELNRSKEDSTQYKLSMTSSPVDVTTCDKGLAVLHEWYGEEKILNDTSHTIRVTDNPDKYEGFIVNYETKTGQWDLGNTRITAMCRMTHFPTVTTVNSSIGFFDVIFSDKKLQKAIIPVVTISCSQNYVISGDDKIYSTEKKPDFIFKYDENNRHLLNQNNTQLNAEIEITDNEFKIVNVKEEEKVKLLFTINRVTGIFLGKLILKNSNIKTEITGECEKIDLKNKKF